METGRLEAFSDGVFAIAITLLILNIHAPNVSEGSLGQALWHEWPEFVGFVVSFLTIGVMWVNHHHMFKQLARADRVFLFLNLLLLMCIAFIPFPTGLLAEHIRDAGAETAALLYGVTGVLVAIFFNGMWHYAVRQRRLLRVDAGAREVSGITRSYAPGIPIYATATLVALASPYASAAMYAAIAVFYALSNTFFGREPVE